ncbi:DUF1834 family protein [Mariprofundus ferrooxydans]|uniref:DUF1834 family protein n=1 Tax=Mariprofundus ferrooxydans PV-1 TaxID=314345 RepID=Q0F1R5_9PROT|nr:DUF1834 family protein [Mariprofundus ferrooxydans]EAU55835.1 hypothetical protein SPV1_02767 [Mariprofundus ferrooxydans PV-1]KON47020.1 hypothetical protein AL013_10545 [Mariprofundus ferrooxydans]
MIDAIEDAIINRIEAARPGLGYQLKAVASYGGELDEDLGQVVRGFPAIWVTFAGSGKSRKKNSAGSKWITPATFAVMHAARNVRGERATRYGVSVGGAILEVGVYQMLADTRTMLLGNDLGLPITKLQPGATRTLYNTRLGGQGIAVFVREWHTEFVEEMPREAIDPTSGDFLKLGIDYHLQPDDGTADLSDEITLA